MGKFGGLCLKLTQTLLYALEFLCAAIILGIYSYFLSVLADRNLPIAEWKKAVEGLSGAAVVYLIFAVILTCFLGGMTFFAFLAIVLDVAFAAAFIAIAVMTRHGVSSCTGNVNTPLGSGPADKNSSGYGDNGFGFGSNENSTYFPNLGLACRLNKTAFAVSIIGAGLFLISAFFQLFLGRHHQREKRFGPSPANNYTSGSGNRKFWQRRNKGPRTTHDAYAKDAEAGTVGTGGLAVSGGNEYRPSHDTAYTGSTVGGDGTFTGNKYESTPAQPSFDPATSHGTHGYHTGPTGTGVNPYGYENRTAGAGTNF